MSLRSFRQRWKALARRIGDVQARVLLTLFYFLVLMPFALIVRWRADPLAIGRSGPRGWRPRERRVDARESARHQF